MNYKIIFVFFLLNFNILLTDNKLLNINENLREQSNEIDENPTDKNINEIDKNPTNENMEENLSTVLDPETRKKPKDNSTKNNFITMFSIFISVFIFCCILFFGLKYCGKENLPQEPLEKDEDSGLSSNDDNNFSKQGSDKTILDKSKIVIPQKKSLADVMNNFGNLIVNNINKIKEREENTSYFYIDNCEKFTDWPFDFETFNDWTLSKIVNGDFDGKSYKYFISKQTINSFFYFEIGFDPNNFNNNQFNFYDPSLDFSITYYPNKTHENIMFNVKNDYILEKVLKKLQEKDTNITEVTIENVKELARTQLTELLKNINQFFINYKKSKDNPNKDLIIESIITKHIGEKPDQGSTTLNFSDLTEEEQKLLNFEDGFVDLMEEFTKDFKIYVLGEKDNF